MKKIHLIVYISLMAGTLLLAKPAELPYGAHLQAQLKQLMAWNDYCLANNKKEERIYFFTYEPGQDIDFSQYTCQEEWFNYHLLPNSGEGLFGEEACQYLNEKLRAFNQAGEENINNNAERITVYGFFINDFKGYIKAKPEELMAGNGGSILNYLQQNPEKVGPDAYASYKSYKDALNEKVNGFHFGNSENNLLIYGAGFKAYDWKEQYQRIYTVNAKATGPFLEQSDYCRKAFQDNQFEQRAYPFHFPTASEAARRYTNAVVSQLEFLASPALKEACEECGPTLSQYLNELWDEKARNFLRERCTQLKEHPDRLSYAFTIAQFIQSLGSIYDDYEMHMAHPDEYNWSGQWEEYLAFEAALKAEETKVETAHQLLQEAIEKQDWYQIFLTLCHFKSPVYFERLSEIDRLSAIKVLAAGPMLGRWLWGNHEQQVIHLLQYVPDEPAYIEQFLGLLKNTPGLLAQLLNKIENHWIGPDTRMQFIQTLSKLVQRRPPANQVHSDYTLIWDLPDQLVKDAFEYDFHFTNAGLIQFNFKQCTAVDQYYTGNNFTEQRPGICIEKEDSSWEPLDPFALVNVAALDKITVLDICGAQGCKGMVFKNVPAIFAAYLIKQNRIDTKIEQVFAGIEIAGLALGVGEFILAARLGSTTRLLIAGYILASDISDIIIRNEAFQDYLILSLGQEEGNKLYEYFQFFSTLNSIVAGTVGLISVEDAAKAVSSVEKMKEMGLDLNDIEQQLGYAISNLSGKELKSLSHAMRQELESTASGKTALRRARAALGIDELVAVIQTLRQAGASEELIDKIIILPVEDVKLLLSQLTRNENRLLKTFNEKIKLVDSWAIYRQSDDWTFIKDWPEPVFYAHFSDLSQGNNLLEAFEKYPRFSKAYEILYGDGSPLLAIYRSSPEDIKAIDEYLRAYPEKIEALKTGYLAAADKRAYIYGLLGPGKAGSRVAHRIKGLYEAIKIYYNPKGIHFEDEIFDSDIITKVFPDSGEKNGHFGRYWDEYSGAFTFNEGFRYGAPAWIEDVEIPLIEGKGIPTATYVALRQMKILKIPNGSLKKLKLSTVQNAEIMRDIYFIMQRNNLSNLKDASQFLIDEPGIQYAITTMKQAGYDISNIRIESNIYTSYITTHQVRFKKHITEVTDEWLAANNLTWNDKFYIHFDVILELSPIP